MSLFTSENPRASARMWLFYILAAAGFVRIWGIWDYMPSMDEIQFLIISKGRSLSEIHDRALAEVHPPLAWIIRHYLLAFGDDISLQRGFSVLMGLGSVFAMYHLARRLLPTYEQALCAAWLMALIPQSAIASMGLRNYAPFGLFAISAMYFLVKWYQKGKRHDLVLFCLLMLAACATHFSGFMLAAICGLSIGLLVLLNGRYHSFALLCAAYIPLAALAGYFYQDYFAPGKTISLWKTFFVQVGFTPKHPEHGWLADVAYPLLAYFSPLIAVVNRGEPIPADWLSFAQGLTLSLGMVVFVMYCVGCLHLTETAKALIAWGWVITLGFSALELYPFSANRHSLYFLPFYILPLAALTPVRLLTPATGAAAILVGMGISLFALWQDEDFCLTHEHFEQGQKHLQDHLKPGDVLVTGPMGAYFYLIYDKDKGSTPYRDYGDKEYIRQTTLLAPFSSPYAPAVDWRNFRSNLLTRLTQGMGRDGNVWFVQYGWKNQELWYLMQCEPLKPLMEHKLSLDGVHMYSVDTSAFAQFLKNEKAWEQCYQGYAPLVIGTPFKETTD